MKQIYRKPSISGSFIKHFKVDVRIGICGDMNMKRMVLVLLCILLAITFSGCAKKADVKNTIKGNVKTYYEMTDGTWMCDDHFSPEEVVLVEMS